MHHRPKDLEELLDLMNLNYQKDLDDLLWNCDDEWVWDLCLNSEFYLTTRFDFECWECYLENAPTEKIRKKVEELLMDTPIWCELIREGKVVSVEIVEKKLARVLLEDLGLANASAMEFVEGADKQKYSDRVLEIGNGFENMCAMEYATGEQLKKHAQRVLEIGTSSDSVYALRYLNGLSKDEHIQKIINEGVPYNCASSMFYTNEEEKQQLSDLVLASNNLEANVLALSTGNEMQREKHLEKIIAWEF